MIKSLVGTVNWQAPELWVPHPRYNEKVDCYAAGLIIWETLQWHHQTKKYVSLILLNSEADCFAQVPL